LTFLLYGNIFIISALVAGLVIGIAYMLARLFNSETFTAWAKKEIAEFIFSTILIFVILITISQTNIDIKNLITKKQNEVDFSYFNNRYKYKRFY